MRSEFVSRPEPCVRALMRVGKALGLCVLAFACEKGPASGGVGQSHDAGPDTPVADAGDKHDVATEISLGDAAESDSVPATDAGTSLDSDRTDASDGGVRMCPGQPAVMAAGTCRTVADCGPIGPVVCWVGHYDWGPAACPLPPGSQPCPNDCATDVDCSARAGGKCDTYTQACPRCNGHVCRYPPPPCTPTNCGAGARCRADGTCELLPCNEGGACGQSFACDPTSPQADTRGCRPIPCDSGTTCPTGTRCNLASTRADAFGCEVTRCDQGYACPADARCRVGSSRADAHGCELIPCDDGFACPSNTRCTATPPPSSSHGCTPITCKAESDCDCGYCIGGSCSAVPGTCQYAPQ